MTKGERENAIRCLKLWMEREPQLQTYKTCLEALEQQPTVTSTNNSGEMTYPQVEGITPIVVNEDIYECSCGFGWDKNKTSRFHFCPNCGKAVGDGNDYKYIKSISNPTGIEFDIDIPKKVESYGKLLKHPVVKHIMGMDEEQEQIDFVQSHKKIPVTLTVKSGDTVSRQDVLDLPRIKTRNAWGDVIYESVDVEDVRKLPSVKSQEKMGRWIANRCDMYECSECDHIYTDLSGERYGMHYCPNCGVKMSKNPTDSEQEDDWDKLDDIEQSEISRAESEVEE